MNKLVRIPASLSRANPSRRRPWSCDDVEPSLGGDLLAPLRHQRDLVRPQTQGDVEHLGGAGHLEIEDGFHRCGESGDVVVLYMPAILAQVGGDAIGAGGFADDGTRHRVRTVTATRLADGRDVVDVDVEALMDHADSPRSHGAVDARRERCSSLETIE